MKKKYIILLVILVVVATGAYIGIQKFNQKTTDHSKREPDIKISSLELIADFEKDAEAARKKYMDKLIAVTGIVLSSDSSGSVVLGEEGSLSSVTASLDRRHIEDHKKLRPGSTATLKGICTGFTKADGDDLLSALGTTVEMNFASVQE